MKWLGVDTGGTFTDFVLLDDTGRLQIHKVLSTPSAPEQAILQGIREMGLGDDLRRHNLHVVHGSTVATNAALERKGVRTLYIANQGLKDVLTIGRQARRELYNLNPAPESPPVPQELCLEVDCRMDAGGQVLQPLREDEIVRLKEEVAALQPVSIAINLLFSFLNDQHEKQLAEALQEGGYYISRSSEVLPEYKEYERGIATWLNAWLGPIVQAYLRRLGKELGPNSVAIMQSSGGTVALEQATDRAVRLLLSGPAGGLSAALFIGTGTGRTKLLTFDMGGTSTDVALLEGEIKLTNEGRIAGYPVAVPMVDMHTIGAGGGSIAWIDSGGLLQVGPRSAGADPGPACYGRGGQEPTVTDANVVLGRIPESVLLGGYLELDRTASFRVMEPLAERLGMTVEAVAEGIVRIANEHMVRALRVISVFRGYDPKEFALCCFGGAGGLHLCELAEELGVSEAIVPAHGGVLSAFGMLVAPRQRNLTQTIVQLADTCDPERLESGLGSLRQQALEELAREHVGETETRTEYGVACRYKGQSFTLDLSWQAGHSQVTDLVEGFHEAHEQRYGYRLDRAVELVTLKCRVYAPSRTPELPDVEAADGGESQALVVGEGGPVPVVERRSLALNAEIEGPMIVVDKVSTLYLKSGWTLCRETKDHLLLRRINTTAQ